MKIFYTFIFLFFVSSKLSAQDNWRFYDLGILYGTSSISKDMKANGFVFLWDAFMQKGKHLVGAEYETATNMRIAGNKYAADQINLLYGRNFTNNDKSILTVKGFVGAGFYRQSFKRTGSDDKYTSETAVGLKLRLSAEFPVYSRLYVAVSPNTTFNFSNTYFSVLAGIKYRF